MTRKINHKKDFFNIFRNILVYLFLITTTLFVYWQVRNHDFVNFDDNLYVSENSNVQAGITLEGIKWSFSLRNKDRTYWHPLTWLSHMLDCQLYGLRPGRHHMTNLILHIANSLLLFLVFKRITGALWRSAFVAALFALHPINVDSVAWVAERKNVLSTFFWLLTMLTYAHYFKRPCLYRYILTLWIFLLGLLAKPMLMTLPFALLLLDYWPLGRLRSRKMGRDKSSAFVLVLEKVPLFALSGSSIYLSSLSLEQQTYWISMESVPMKLRVENALISYVSYISKMIWPQNMTVYYPYPSTLPMWQAAGAGLLLICVSVFIIRAFREKPYLGIGWLWFLGTLFPVIGLMQAGRWAALADRWAYVPLIGLFVIIAWGVPELVGRWRHKKIGLVTIAAALLSVLMATTWLQVRYWSNSITLFEHAIDVTAKNHLAHYNLGIAFTEQGRTTEAMYHYSKVLLTSPSYVDSHITLDSHINLGVVFSEQERTTEAMYHYSEVLRINPGHEAARNNLANSLAALGRGAEAIYHYSEVLRVNPSHVEARTNLANVLVSQGKVDEALNHYTEALRINPDSAETHNNLGAAFIRKGRIEEAIFHFQEALRKRPGYAKAYQNLKKVLRAKKN